VGPWIAATVYIFLIGGLLFRRLASEQWRRIDIFAVRRAATPLVEEL